MAYNLSNVFNPVFKQCVFQITVPYPFSTSTSFLEYSFFLPFCLRGRADSLSLLGQTPFSSISSHSTSKGTFVFHFSCVTSTFKFPF